MKLHELKPAPGSKEPRKRVGRGSGSGLGKTSGRGHKGQKARSGYSRRSGMEGGQMPLQRRLPKFGFTNIFRQPYQVVNVNDLERLDAGEVTRDLLVESGLVKANKGPVKLLGNGEASKKWDVKLAAFSKSAITKITAAGGTCEVVGAKKGASTELPAVDVSSTPAPEDSAAPDTTEDAG